MLICYYNTLSILKNWVIQVVPLIDLQNKKLETPLGVSCRSCPRVDCQQRALPPIDKDFKLE